MYIDPHAIHNGRRCVRCCRLRIIDHHQREHTKKTMEKHAEKHTERKEIKMSGPSDCYYCYYHFVVWTSTIRLIVFVFDSFVLLTLTTFPHSRRSRRTHTSLWVLAFHSHIIQTASLSATDKTRLIEAITLSGWIWYSELARLGPFYVLRRLQNTTSAYLCVLGGPFRLFLSD